MNKSGLLNYLQERYRQWETILDEVGPARMDQQGVNGDWSMKDVVAHLTGWHRNVVTRFQTAQRGDPEPAPPWPAHLKDEDDINAWIYETNRTRSVREILDESRQVFQQTLTVIENLPDDVRIETVHHEGRDFHLVWIGDKRFAVAEFFDHFRDDHEPTIRAWLAQQETH